MKNINIKQMFLDGILYKNPVLVQLLGLCSVLAVTTSISNGIGMGAAATVVLICSNLLISLLRKYIPKQVRIAAYIVIISGFVTAVELLIKAFLPALDASLGVFIPLIVVNCMILARAEAFASKNKPLPSIIDGLAMGVGYTVALVAISAVRELLGAGTLMGIHVLPDSYEPMLIAILPPGGFIILGCLIALTQKIISSRDEKLKSVAEKTTAEIEEKEAEVNVG
ncbi:MAG: electron transport complex subunit E [Ruminococcaceae bacterium]|nr:electron transport complex subunit E [Oscillospiraceae bacterium]